MLEVQRACKVNNKTMEHTVKTRIKYKTPHIRVVYFRTKKTTNRYIWKGSLATATCKIYHLPILPASCVRVCEGEAQAPRPACKGQVGSSEGRSAICAVRPLSQTSWLVYVGNRHGLTSESLCTQSQGFENLSLHGNSRPEFQSAWPVLQFWCMSV